MDGWAMQRWAPEAPEEKTKCKLIAITSSCGNTQGNTQGNT